MKSDSCVRFPLWLKAAAGLTFFNSWVLFEETIIDRHGLWQYLPLYRVGQPCVWDLAAGIVVALGVWWGVRRRDARTARPAA